MKNILLLFIAIFLLTLALCSCKTIQYKIPVTWCDDFGIREDTLVGFEKNNKVIIKIKEGGNMHINESQIIN